MSDTATVIGQYERKRIFLTGVIWFALASVSGIAPTAGTLIAACALQGAGAALLTPGSLAILQATFRPDDRGKAIGAWSGFTGVGTAIGPFVGGWLIAAASWRLIFAINRVIAVGDLPVIPVVLPGIAVEECGRRADGG